MRYLPSYDPAWSDGCTLSPFLPTELRRPFQQWMIKCLACDPDVARKMRYACETHDMKYYFGGCVEDRLAADKALLQDWKDAGAPYMLRHAAPCCTYVGRTQVEAGRRLLGLWRLVLPVRVPCYPCFGDRALRDHTGTQSGG